jgi:hypothetical protein
MQLARSVNQALTASNERARRARQTSVYGKHLSIGEEHISQSFVRSSMRVEVLDQFPFFWRLAA